MAPSKSKAAKAAPAAGGGLQRWFGGGKAAEAASPATAVAASAEAAPADTPSPAADAAPVAMPAAQATPPEPDASPPADSPAAGGGSGGSQLSQEQQKRIDENRRKAMALRQSKQATADAPAAAVPATVPAVAAPVPFAAAASSPAKPAGASLFKPATPSPAKPATPAASPMPSASPSPGKLASPAPAGRAGEAAACAVPVSCTRGAWGQYHGLYAARLRLLRPAALEEARALWSGMVPPDGFAHDITGYKTGVNGSEVVLTGILFKDMKERPNLIEHYREGKGLGAAPLASSALGRQKLCSDADVLWLEDHMMRIGLVASADDVGRLATGLVVAVRGAARLDGRFKASGFCLARMPPAPLLPQPACPAGVGPFVAFVSGLGMDIASEGLSSARERALEFLLGGGQDEREATMGRAVQQVLICGGVVSSSPALRDVPKAALEEADSFISRLAVAKAVCIMPGAGDPSSVSLPQMALHPRLFRRSRACTGFQSAGNPHSCSVEGLALAGHSGQPVEDLLRCTRLEQPLEALATCLEALHLAPTAPDTVSMHPFADDDPFVLRAVPHVLFSGGHDRFDREWRASARGGPGTLCVCVPAFHLQPVVVLVNLQDPRDVRVQDFSDTPGFDAHMGTVEATVEAAGA